MSNQTHMKKQSVVFYSFVIYGIEAMSENNMKNWQVEEKQLSDGGKKVWTGEKGTKKQIKL